MNSMKRQKDGTLKEELPRSVGTNMLLEISGEITPEKLRDGAKVKTTPSCGCDVIEAKSNAVRIIIA